MRAFQKAQTDYPFMGVMFLWNLNFSTFQEWYTGPSHFSDPQPRLVAPAGLLGAEEHAEAITGAPATPRTGRTSLPVLGCPTGTRIAFKATGKREINPHSRRFRGVAKGRALDVARLMW